MYMVSPKKKIFFFPLYSLLHLQDKTPPQYKYPHFFPEMYAPDLQI